MSKCCISRVFVAGQVQKLLARHKAELGAVQAAAAEEARRALDVAAAQHELAMRGLKERMSKVCVTLCLVR